MDECELEDIGQTCTGTCINTIGSFRCSEEDAGSQEDGRDEEADERDAEAIQEVITSTQGSTTTTTQTTTPVATTTTTSTVKSVDKMTTTTTTTTETAVPEEDEEESQPEEEEEDRVIDNHIVNVVETKESGSQFDQTTCPDGFQVADRLAETEDGSACTDVDECESDNKFGCSHLCVNTQGSAHCECPSGWKLEEDGKRCQGELKINHQDNL